MAARRVRRSPQHPPPDDTITELAALAGQNPAEFLQRYWQARPGYDPGQPAARYWPPVLGRDLAGQPSLVDQLTGVDVRGWLRLNCLSLRTLLSCTRRTGSRLALLANAPEPLATAIDRCHWTWHFARRFYSCRLGHAKPDPAAFAFVLAQLAADPDDVLFIDDPCRQHRRRRRARHANHHVHLRQRPSTRTTTHNRPG
jgi:putative hydrolase of the HAD superfamily